MLGLIESPMSLSEKLLAAPELGTTRAVRAGGGLKAELQIKRVNRLSLKRRAGAPETGVNAPEDVAAVSTPRTVGGALV
jgi:hypothetical protein